MIMYALKHIPSGKFMPEMKRGKGYTHWNPSNQQPVTCIKGGIRLFEKRKSAEAAKDYWYVYPNMEMGNVRIGLDETEWGLKSNPDGRKLEELEVVKVQIRIVK